YANAYHLDPKNRDAALGYAEALTRSSDPEDNRRGGEMMLKLLPAGDARRAVIERSIRLAQEK
ncbi:cytochrome C biogenesis protein, partial [Salmonella enterica subsp. enterica]|nr:cytochrome C biogenesis protein [Salmonella enterica subsp. enterica serovar Abony]